MSDKAHCNKILGLLSEAHPDAAPQLNFSNPFELLIATMLSAQCTDNQVNKCTKQLFIDRPDAHSMAAMTEDELTSYIKPCGLYKTKCKNILATCRILTESYGGGVPKTLEELTALPGVGRKTANVVMSNAFGTPAIAVDTHVARVSVRLGLADGKDVLKIEKQLMENIPRESWSIAHHWLIFHGRRVCAARNPRCTECTLSAVCREYNKTYKGDAAGRE